MRKFITGVSALSLAMFVGLAQAGLDEDIYAEDDIELIESITEPATARTTVEFAALTAAHFDEELFPEMD